MASLCRSKGDILYDISAKIASRRVALLLDYDGTLVNGPPTPSRERRPTKALVATLNALHDRGALLAIITGRSNANLLDVLPDAARYNVASSHGLSIRAGYDSTGRDGGALPLTVGADELPAVHAALDFTVRELCSRGLASRGVAVNDEAHFFSFQVAGLPEEVVREALSLAHASVDAAQAAVCAGALYVRQLKGVIEVRPGASERWDKGSATTYLLRCARLIDSENVAAIAIGDDVSDEPMFRAILDAGCGAAIAVHVGEKPPAWSTLATHTVNDHTAVEELLAHILAHLSAPSENDACAVTPDSCE